jgi:RHS repeat-associated protein
MVSQDEQGSVTWLHRADGSEVEAVEYDPYGKRTVFPEAGGSQPRSTVGFDVSYTGHRIDHETGLIYARNRYLHTGWGRFLTIDPLGAWVDGDNSGNGYGYVGNMPTGATDPLGLLSQGGWPWHHIIPKGQEFADWHRIMEKLFGYDVHDPRNGLRVHPDLHGPAHGNSQGFSDYNQVIRRFLEDNLGDRAAQKNFEEFLRNPADNIEFLRDWIRNNPERVGDKGGMIHDMLGSGRSVGGRWRQRRLPVDDDPIVHQHDDKRGPRGSGDKDDDDSSRPQNPKVIPFPGAVRNSVPCQMRPSPGSPGFWEKVLRIPLVPIIFTPMFELPREQGRERRIA